MTQVLIDAPWVEQPGTAGSPVGDASTPTVIRNPLGKLTRPTTWEDQDRDVIARLSPSPELIKAGHAPALDPLLIRPNPIWKRLMDIAGALFGLTLFLPLMIATAIAIKLTSRGPIIFKQKRAGLGGKIFTLYKFRTMYVDAEKHKAELMALNELDGPVFKITNDPRFTPIGGFLRRTSIDELPQLWNVLMGTMSLVGPRPLVCEEANACETWQRRRLEVMPGITCIWQTHGRSNVSFDEWMLMDLTYVYARSLPVDVMLLLQTIPAVIGRRGAR